MKWFRRGDDGHYLWPGYGENSRILKWVFERLEHSADAVNTPIGYVPYPAALDTEGLALPDTDLESALRVDASEWNAEVPLITEWFQQFGDRLPTSLWAELDSLHSRLATP